MQTSEKKHAWMYGWMTSSSYVLESILDSLGSTSPFSRDGEEDVENDTKSYSWPPMT